MSNKIFEERLKRIAHNGPSGETIPGQVGEISPSEARALGRNAKGAKPKSRLAILTSILFGGIVGAIVGILFQEVVGVQVFLNFDWQAEWAIMQSDLVRAGIWGTIAMALTLLLLSLSNRKKFRRIASWSTAFVFTAVAVNAQDLFYLVPPETIAQLAGG